MQDKKTRVASHFRIVGISINTYGLANSINALISLFIAQMQANTVKPYIPECIQLLGLVAFIRAIYPFYGFCVVRPWEANWNL